MKSLLILLGLLFTLALSGCKEGTIVYDVEFPLADSNEAQPKRIAPASVSLLVTSANLAENAGSVLVSATLNKTASSATTVLLSLSGSAVLNTDYSIDNTTIEIPAGSLAASTTLRSLDDLIDDDAETIIIEISTVSGGDGVTEDGDQQDIVTITDDELSPAVTLSTSVNSFSENVVNPAVTLTVTMTAAATNNTTIILTTSGTATQGIGNDYTIASTTLVIPAGSTSTTTTISTIDDSYYDDGETITVEISSVSGSTAAESGNQSVTITINDDEAQPTVSLTVGSNNLTEAVGPSDDTLITATLSYANSLAVSVVLSLSGTAANPADYSIGSTTLTIPAGSTTATTTVTTQDDAISEGSETVIVDISSVSGGDSAVEASPAQQVTVTISDDEANPSVTLSTSTNSLNETGAGDNATLTVTINPVASSVTTVTLALSGTATGGGSDYSIGSTTLTIPAGVATATATISTQDDPYYDDGETIIVDISSVSGGNSATESGTQQETITFNDNEIQPTVSLGVDTNNMGETGGTATLTVSLSYANSATTTVTLGTSGTAMLSNDYTLSSTTINIAAGNTSGTATLSSVGDSISDPSEYVDVDITNVSGGDNATEATPAQQERVTITDDEALPVIRLSSSASTVSEVNTSVTLTVTATPASSSVITVNLAETGTATGSGTDYSLAAAVLNIAANNSSTTTTITTVDDGVYDPAETAIIDINSVSGGSASESGTQQQTITITDDEGTPTVSLSVDNNTVSEGAGTGARTVAVTLSNTASDNVTVGLSTSGTATGGGVDYTLNSNSLLIAAGSTTANTTLDISEDLLIEGTETIVLDISSVTNSIGITENGVQQQTINLTDNEAGPTVSLSSSSPIAENGGTSTVTATLSAAAAQSTTVNLLFSGTADNGTDYSRSASSIAIPANRTSSSITVTGVNDSFNDEAETVIVDIDTVSGGNGASESGTQRETITITDDDPTPTVSLSSSAASILESAGADAVTLTVTISAVAESNTTATLLLSGTATKGAGTDYTINSSTITIAAGALSGTAKLTILEDSLSEVPNETIVVDIAGVSGGDSAVEATPAQQVTVTITDNEATPQITLAPASASPIAENGGTSTVTATSTPASSSAITVNLSLSGSADNGSDYSIGTTSLTIPANTATTSTLVTGVSDATFDPAETIVIDIASVSGGSAVEFGGNQQETITITDDDNPPVVDLLVSASSVNESSGSAAAAITALLDHAATVDTLVTLNPSGTADNGSDYTLDNFTISVSAGATSGSTNLNLLQDSVSENPAETIVLDITGVSGGDSASENGTQSQTITLVDDEATPQITLAPAPTSPIAENRGTSTVTVTSSIISSSTITVTLSAGGGATATAGGVDYSLGSSSLVIAAGSSTQTTTITSVDDNITEGNEAVVLDITAVSGGGAAESGTPQQIAVTITDDDSAGFTLSKTTASVAETGTTDTFTVVLNSEPTANVTLTLSDNDSTEVLYPSSLVFSTGNWSTSQTVTLTGKDDDVDDGNRSTLLTLTPSSTDSNFNAPGLAAQTMTVTTSDNDNAGFTISRTTADVSENGTTTTFTVVLNTEPTNTVELDISSDDLTEARVSPGSLTFSTGNWTIAQTVTITGWDDNEDDDNVTSTTSIAIDQPNTLDSVYDGISLQTINVLTIDDEEMPIVTLSAAAANVTESGTLQITATQNRTAGTDTTVNLSITDGMTVSGDYNAPAAITITANTTSGSINFAPVNDSIDEDDETLTIQISSITGGQGAQAGTPQQISVTINDDDTAGFTLSTTSVSVNEASTTSQTLTVVLDTEPTGNVVFDLSHNDTTEASISPSSLTFITGNWNTAKSVMVTAADELIDDGDTNSTITVSIDTGSTADTKYDLLGSQTVTVTTVDDDTSSLTVPVLACAVEIGQVKLTWTDIYTSDGAGPVDSYILYWDISSGIDESDNSVTSINERAMTDAPNAYFHGGLSDNHTYSYRVAVVNSGMVQTLSNEVSCQPLAPMCDITSGYIVDNDSDLVAYYPFEDNTNDILNISKTGSPYHLSVQTGSVNYADSCVMGKSIYLNGNTYLENADFNLNNISEIEDNFTASMWVIADKDNIRNASVLASGEKIGSDWDELSQVSYDTDGSLKWRVRKTSGSGSVDGPIMVLGEWYHLVMTHSKADNHAEYFVDGVSQGTRPGAVHNWRKLRIGRNRAGAMQWKGYIDELKIYKRTMNSSEVENLYLKSLAPSTKSINLTSGGSGTLILDWNDVKGHTGNYRVYRGTSSDFYVNISSDTPIYDGTTSGYSDSSLVSGQTYCYRVLSRSVNGRGNMSDDFCRNAP